MTSSPRRIISRSTSRTKIEVPESVTAAIEKRNADAEAATLSPPQQRRSRRNTLTEQAPPTAQDIDSAEEDSGRSSSAQRRRVSEQPSTSSQRRASANPTRRESALRPPLATIASVSGPDVNEVAAKHRGGDEHAGNGNGNPRDASSRMARLAELRRARDGGESDLGTVRTTRSDFPDMRDVARRATVGGGESEDRHSRLERLKQSRLGLRGSTPSVAPQPAGTPNSLQSSDSAEFDTPHTISRVDSFHSIGPADSFGSTTGQGLGAALAEARRANDQANDRAARLEALRERRQKSGVDPSVSTPKVNELTSVTTTRVGSVAVSREFPDTLSLPPVKEKETDKKDKEKHAVVMAARPDAAEKTRYISVIAKEKQKKIEAGDAETRKSSVGATLNTDNLRKHDNNKLNAARPGSPMALGASFSGVFEAPKTQPARMPSGPQEVVFARLAETALSKLDQPGNMPVAPSGGQRIQLPLPSGWTQSVDPFTNQPLYINSATGASSSFYPNIQPADPSPEALAAAGWSTHHDAATRRNYYYHASTGRTTWFVPSASMLRSDDPQAADEPSNGGGGGGGGNNTAGGFKAVVPWPPREAEVWRGAVEGATHGVPRRMGEHAPDEAGLIPVPVRDGSTWDLSGVGEDVPEVVPGPTAPEIGWLTDAIVPTDCTSTLWNTFLGSTLGASPPLYSGLDIVRSEWPAPDPERSSDYHILVSMNKIPPVSQVFTQVEDQTRVPFILRMALWHHDVRLSNDFVIRTTGKGETLTGRAASSLFTGIARTKNACDLQAFLIAGTTPVARCRVTLLLQNTTISEDAQHESVVVPLPWENTIDVTLELKAVNPTLFTSFNFGEDDLLFKVPITLTAIRVRPPQRPPSIRDDTPQLLYTPTSSLRVTVEDVLPPTRNDFYMGVHMSTLVDAAATAGVPLPPAFLVVGALLDSTGRPLGTSGSPSVVGTYPITRTTREANHLVLFSLPPVPPGAGPDFSAHVLLRFIAPAGPGPWTGNVRFEPCEFDLESPMLNNGATFAFAFLMLYPQEGCMRSDNEYDLKVFFGPPPSRTLAPGVNPSIKLPVQYYFRSDVTPESCVSTGDEPSSTVPNYLAHRPADSRVDSAFARTWPIPLAVKLDVVSGEVLDDNALNDFLQREPNRDALAALILAEGTLLSSCRALDLYKFHGLAMERLAQYYRVGCGADVAPPASVLGPILRALEDVVAALADSGAADKRAQEIFEDAFWRALPSAMVVGFANHLLGKLNELGLAGDAAAQLPRWVTCAAYVLNLGACRTRTERLPADFDVSVWPGMLRNYCTALTSISPALRTPPLRRALCRGLAMLHPGALAVLSPAQWAATLRPLLPREDEMPTDPAELAPYAGMLSHFMQRGSSRSPGAEFQLILHLLPEACGFAAAVLTNKPDAALVGLLAPLVGAVFFDAVPAVMRLSEQAHSTAAQTLTCFVLLAADKLLTPLLEYLAAAPYGDFPTAVLALAATEHVTSLTATRGRALLYLLRAVDGNVAATARRLTLLFAAWQRQLMQPLFPRKSLLPLVCTMVSAQLRAFGVLAGRVLPALSLGLHEDVGRRLTGWLAAGLTSPSLQATRPSIFAAERFLAETAPYELALRTQGALLQRLRTALDAGTVSHPSIVEALVPLLLAAYVSTTAPHLLMAVFECVVSVLLADLVANGSCVAARRALLPAIPNALSALREPPNVGMLTLAARLDALQGALMRVDPLHAVQARRRQAGLALGERGVDAASFGARALDELASVALSLVRVRGDLAGLSWFNDALGTLAATTPSPMLLPPSAERVASGLESIVSFALEGRDHASAINFLGRLARLHKEGGAVLQLGHVLRALAEVPGAPSLEAVLHLPPFTGDVATYPPRARLLVGALACFDVAAAWESAAAACDTVAEILDATQPQESARFLGMTASLYQRVATVPRLYPCYAVVHLAGNGWADHGEQPESFFVYILPPLAGGVTACVAWLRERYPRVPVLTAKDDMPAVLPSRAVLVYAAHPLHSDTRVARPLPIGVMPQRHHEGIAAVAAYGALPPWLPNTRVRKVAEVDDAYYKRSSVAPVYQMDGTVRPVPAHLVAKLPTKFAPVDPPCYRRIFGVDAADVMPGFARRVRVASEYGNMIPRSEAVSELLSRGIAAIQWHCAVAIRCRGAQEPPLDVTGRGWCTTCEMRLQAGALGLVGAATAAASVAPVPSLAELFPAEGPMGALPNAAMLGLDPKRRVPFIVPVQGTPELPVTRVAAAGLLEAIEGALGEELDGGLMTRCVVNMIEIVREHTKFLLERVREELKMAWIKDNKARTAAGLPKLVSPNIDGITMHTHPQVAAIEEQARVLARVVEGALVLHQAMLTAGDEAAAEGRRGHERAELALKNWDRTLLSPPVK